MDGKTLFNFEDFHPELFTDTSPIWRVLDHLERYLRAQSLGRHLGQISPHAYLVNPELISIGEGSVVEPGAYIEGPVILGRGCTVRHGAYIRGNLLTGDGCVIGHATEVKNSIFLSGAKAAHFAYVGDSILGNNVNLGAGVRCANYRLDGGEIFVEIEGQQIATGRKKLGAIIGDESNLGCNCVTNPGTLLMSGSRCFPCTSVGTNLPIPLTTP